MSDPFIAEIRAFPFNFAPKGWASCNGQVLPISQFTALFALLGTTYGGNGRTTFALPNLQGSVPLHVGNGPGRPLGETGGSTSATLSAAQIPAHTHDLTARNGPGQTGVADGAVLGKAGWVQGSQSGVSQQYGSTAQGAKGNAAMSPQAVQSTGAGAPHNSMMPYLAVNFCIALQGIFPPRP